MVAALAARDAGLAPLVLEKRELLGGSTAMSGGVVWVPNNPLMVAEGVPDSEEDGLTYFDEVVGDIGSVSSEEKRRAYIVEGGAMLGFLADQGIRLIRCEGYSDYYPHVPGGVARGRSVEPVPFDAKALGAWRDKIQRGLANEIGLALTTNELRAVPQYNRSLRYFGIAVRVWTRTMVSRLRRQDLLTNGSALIARLAKAALDRGIPLWLSAGVDDLVVENGRVVGVLATKDGRQQRIQACHGVLLSAGGFAHNAEMRRKYGGDQPNEGKWTWANPGDTGEALAAAMRLEAKTDLLDEAWWIPTPIAPELSRSTLSVARQRPGTIMVDAAGQRFCNESNSYVEVGKAMYARDKHAHAVPSWLIFDDGYRRRYAAAKTLPGRLPAEWLDKGVVRRNPTLDGLAREIGVDPDGLVATVERFNRYAKDGTDPDFGRGQNAYNHALGDPGYKPNPAVGPLDRAPYYAVEIYPADVGTCGGLVTDVYSQVMGEDDQPIPGLYAAGNITATVMGRTYPGAGASIGNSMTFGYIAARHAARSARVPA